VRHYTMSRLVRASAFAQRRLCRVVANDHATARTHRPHVSGAADGGLRGACWGLDALEDRNGLGWCPCWLRQLLLERSDGHCPDEVCGQREVHEGVDGARRLQSPEKNPEVTMNVPPFPEVRPTHSNFRNRKL
jgi:hypothetical protein